jgi:hypothetical protein
MSSPSLTEVLKQPRSVSPWLEKLAAFCPAGHWIGVVLELAVAVNVNWLEVDVDWLEEAESILLELLDERLEKVVSVEELEEV